MVDRKVLVDDFPDGLLTVGASLDIELANVAIATLVGLAPSDLIGRNLDVVLRRSASVRAPGRSSRHCLYELIEALVSGPEGAPGGLMRCIAPILLRGGVELEVAWTVAGLGRPSDTGGARGALITVRGLEESIQFVDDDSHDRARANRVHQIIFENAPIGIFHYDARGIVTACNDAFVALIGSSRRQLIGIDLHTLRDAGIIRCIDDSLAGRRSSFHGDYASVTALKTTPVNADFAPVLDADRQVVGGVGLIQDVTEHRRAERLVARAERMASLGTLAAGTVHEIQNPLAFTVTSIDLAARALDGPLDENKLAEIRTAMQNAREGAARVSSIARDLRTFARASDELRSDVDVVAVIESALELISAQLDARAILVRELAPLPPVRANEHRLVQLFVNLLANAVESIDEGHRAENRVAISTKLDVTGRIEVAIEDSGRGMPTIQPERVFEPFWTSKPTGMGLGLAICHGIVSALGGEITHEKRTDERGAALPGTRFVVKLPIAPDRQLEAAARNDKASTERSVPREKSIAPASHAPAERGRILVVDDEERLAATMKLALSPSHDVDIATSGDGAIAKLRAKDYDVILCDLLLPDISGPEIFEAMRSLRPELLERFVFLTGGAFGDRARSFLQEVPNPRLEKPFDLGTLEALIAERLEMVRASKA